MLIKFVALLVARLILLIGAILVPKEISIWIRLCLLIGGTATVLSGLAALFILTPTDFFRSLPSFWIIANILEVGGWALFSIGFLALIMKLRKN